MQEEVSIEFVRDIAKQAGCIIKDKFFSSKKINTKLSSADLVTETDLQVENKLKSLIKHKFPNHSFLCEESAGEADRLTDNPTWIIDPIDGTTNFVHSFPFTCVSIGFSRNKDVLLGVIYNPILEEEFYAYKGGGAFLNENRIKVSSTEKIDSALIATSLGISKIRKLNEPNLNSEETKFYQSIKDRTIKNISSLVTEIRDLRVVGSCAMQLAYVACGRLDAYIEFGVKEWDMAAGILLVTEGGGFVKDVNGKKVDMGKHRLIAASSENLIENIINTISSRDI